MTHRLSEEFGNRYTSHIAERIWKSIHLVSGLPEQDAIDRCQNIKGPNSYRNKHLHKSLECPVNIHIHGFVIVHGT